MRRIWKDESPLPRVETMLLRGTSALALAIGIFNPADYWPLRFAFMVISALLIVLSMDLDRG